MIKLIMANGRPLKWVKAHKPQKVNIQHLREVCVQYDGNPPMGFPDLLRKRNVDRRTDIQGAVNTHRHDFDEQGIKTMVHRFAKMEVEQILIFSDWEYKKNNRELYYNSDRKLLLSI